MLAVLEVGMVVINVDSFSSVVILCICINCIRNDHVQKSRHQRNDVILQCLDS